MTVASPQRRKLIEVSLPLETINAESTRENYIYKGNPSTVHKWWAQRPLAAARAVLFAQLVDDPSSDPTLSEEEQKVERERLHDIIRRLVKWENISDERLYAEARAEIKKSTGGNPPAILDPFAGGGTIPLEAQRLGLEAHASDLNPVAVLINKALIEIPPKFAGQPPVSPDAETRTTGWPRAEGLAEDVRRYGAWMHARAAERIGHLYPKATLPPEYGGGEATVIAWIWARTVTCPNPACGIQMPLVRSWWLGKKKGKEAYVAPTVVDDATAPSGKRVAFTIKHDPKRAPTVANDGTVGRQGAECVACQTAVALKYIRFEGKARRMSSQLMAVVAEGNRRRIYVEPTPKHITAADLPRPDDAPSGALPTNPRDFKTPNYGMTEWADLFTNRQLTALTALSDLVNDAREQVLKDALEAGLTNGDPRTDRGSGAEAYADAVATYLAMAVAKYADYGCTLAVWYPQEGRPKNLFARQAIPMTWDYPEIMPLTSVGGGFANGVRLVSESFEKLGAGPIAQVTQADASTRTYSNVVVSTDPPYYDNIGYSELSDFFYVWLRRSLGSIHPKLFETMLTPKMEELVANPYRHDGRENAERFFETGFEHVFGRARETASDDYPITVFYAFKQAELEKEGVASTGWSTLLEGMIREGWTITATWPVRSERSGRMTSVGTNALASSIVLSLRPRHETAQATNRRGFLAALKAELPDALREMQQGAIAPVDLAQATIGPGMAVFSRYSRVLESDGTAMSVKTALALINQALDEVLAEQDSELDPETRFCVDWYRQYGWETKPFGEADTLARAKNTSVEGLARGGVVKSGGGKVTLIAPADLDASWDPMADDRVSLWEATCHLARSYAADGGEATARLLAAVGQRVDLDAVQLLAYRLYELSQDSRPQDALLFNGLGTSWADLTLKAREVGPPAVQGGFDFDAIDD